MELISFIKWRVAVYLFSTKHKSSKSCHLQNKPLSWTHHICLVWFLNCFVQKLGVM